MSVSFQFQQDNINNPVIKQEVLEVVASTSRVTVGEDDTKGGFWRAASSGRMSGGLGGLFHRGPPTSANASLSSSKVVFFLGQTIQFDRIQSDKAFPAYEFMLGGKVYLVRTGSDPVQALASNRKALSISARAGATATGAMNYLLSQSHRHSPTGAADFAPAPAPLPINIVQLPSATAVTPAITRARANSDFPNYAQNDSPPEDLYQNQESLYRNA